MIHYIPGFCFILCYLYSYWNKLTATQKMFKMKCYVIEIHHFITKSCLLYIRTCIAILTVVLQRGNISNPGSLQTIGRVFLSVYIVFACEPGAKLSFRPRAIGDLGSYKILNIFSQSIFCPYHRTAVPQLNTAISILYTNTKQIWNSQLFTLFLWLTLGFRTMLSQRIW